MSDRARLRIFVVEDSALLLQRIIEDIAALDRFEIVGHEDAEDEAVSAIHRLDPEIVVTDLQLKAGSGIGVLRRVRARKPQSPPLIFVLTNYTMSECVERCLAFGADGFFDKSSQYNVLIARLRQTTRESAWESPRAF